MLWYSIRLSTACALRKQKQKHKDMQSQVSKQASRAIDFAVVLRIALCLEKMRVALLCLLLLLLLMLMLSVHSLFFFFNSSFFFLSLYVLSNSFGMSHQIGEKKSTREHNGKLTDHGIHPSQWKILMWSRRSVPPHTADIVVRRLNYQSCLYNVQEDTLCAPNTRRLILTTATRWL